MVGLTNDCSIAPCMNETVCVNGCSLQQGLKRMLAYAMLSNDVCIFANCAGQALALFSVYRQGAPLLCRCDLPCDRHVL